MSLSEKLIKIIEAKKDINYEIGNKKVNMTGAVFEEYDNKIDEIDLSNMIELEGDCSYLFYFLQKFKSDSNAFKHFEKLLLRIDLSKVTKAFYMFSGSQLINMPEILNLVSCVDCSCMFINCKNLVKMSTVIDLPNCTNTNHMFSHCENLLNLPKILNLSNCTDVSYMFYNCKNLINLPEVLDLSNCTDASYMFSGCEKIVSMPKILGLSKCVNTSRMFSSCLRLKTLPDLDLSNCVDCSLMFYECSSLTYLSKPFDLSNCTDTSSMFNRCSKLTYVTLGDIGKPIKSLANDTFYACWNKNLTINIYTSTGEALSGCTDLGATYATINWLQA